MTTEFATKEQVEATFDNLKELLKEAQVYVREAEAEVANRKGKADRIIREMRVWEATLVAFKEQGIV